MPVLTPPRTRARRLPDAARAAIAAAFAAVLASLAGCERMVSLTVPTGETRLVVEARLERRQDRPDDGRQLVRLTTTDAYFVDRAPPPARGATVRVRDDAGRTVTLAEAPGEPGVYATDALPVALGRPYTLVIDWEGDRYEATDAATPVPPIDALYLAPRAGQVGPRDGARATIDFRDPDGVANHYLWDQLVDGVRAVAPDSTARARAVSSDEILEGRRVTGYQPYGGVVVPPGAAVVIRQVGLSAVAYRYYRALSDQTGNDGSPFGVPAASVRGNVANTTRPVRRALGYLIVADVAEARWPASP
jgi:hypothetical protein